ncbi:hypothetical protein OPQ81_005887 [Rhizoctonia solani]|nr:hypothetical protein OPQ81_005887 [Rhizoctonia solani]
MRTSQPLSTQNTVGLWIPAIKSQIGTQPPVEFLPIFRGYFNRPSPNTDALPNLLTITLLATPLYYAQAPRAHPLSSNLREVEELLRSVKSRPIRMLRAMPNIYQFIRFSAPSNSTKTFFIDSITSAKTHTVVDRSRQIMMPGNRRGVTAPIATCHPDETHAKHIREEAPNPTSEVEECELQIVRELARSHIFHSSLFDHLIRSRYQAHSTNVFPTRRLLWV